MTVPCVTCRTVLSRLDLADGLRCQGCTEDAFKDLDSLQLPVDDWPDDWRIGLWPDAGSTTVALLLAMLGFVGLVLVEQAGLCVAQPDTVRSYCEAQR